MSIDVEHEKLATKRAEKRLQALRRQGNKKSNQLLNNSQVVHQSDSESDVSLNNVRGNTSTNSNKELPRTNEHANKLATARASWEEMQNYIHMSDRQLDKSVLRESSEFQRMLKERMLNSDNSNNSVSRGNNNRPYSHQSGDRLESPTRSSKPPLPLEKVQYNSDDLRPMRSTAPTAELVSAINSSGIAFKPKVSMTPDVSDSESISREKAAKTVEFVRRKALSLNDSVESFGKRSVSFVQDSKNSSPIRNNSVLTSLEHSIRESRETLKQPSASSTEAIEKKSPVREQLQRAATMEKPRAESAKQQFERLQLLYEKVSSFK